MSLSESEEEDDVRRADDDDEDNDDEGSSKGGMSLTSFLFGNIDTKTGDLEAGELDFLNNQSLQGLQKLGVGLSDTLLENEEEQQSKDKEGADKTENSTTISKEDQDDKKFEGSSDSDNYDSDDSDSERRKRNKDKSSSKQPAQVTSQSSSIDSETEKSPSAVDYSDINEAIEEDISSLPSGTTGPIISGSLNKDETDYDEEEEEDKSVKIKDVELMPPPPIRPTSISLNKEPAKVNQVGEKELSDAITSISNLSPQKSASSSLRKLETPLAAMLPSKYADVDVTEIFPDFRPERVLRFSRLFGLGKSAASLPQTWKNVKKRRKKRKMLLEGGSIVSSTPSLSLSDQTLTTTTSTTSSTTSTSISATLPTTTEEVREKIGWNFTYGDEPKPEDLVEDQANIFLEKVSTGKDDKSTLAKRISKDKNNSRQDGKNKATTWRNGPAKLWYDMLQLPDDQDDLYFDYGFKLKEKKKKQQNGDYDDEEGDSSEGDSEDEEKEVSQLPPIPPPPDDAFLMVTQLKWENDIIWDPAEYKLRQKREGINKSAGWIPSSKNRTIASLPGSKPELHTNPMPSTSSGKRGKDLISSMDSSDDTWYSIFPVETPELVYGNWEDDIIWDVDNMKKIPEPKILTLDPNDENIILYIPDDVDPNELNKEHTRPVKVKIPHPHVKKSKILLGKAGVINVIEEDSPPPSPKIDDKDPYNISNDEYYMPKFTEQSMLKISASGNIIQHSTPVVELRAPFIPTHMGQLKLRNFHRPLLKGFSHGPLADPGPHPVIPLTKHIKKKAKAREQERLAAGGGDIFFMRTPEDLSGKDGELLLVEYCEEHPPILAQVGMCSKIKNYYKRKAGKDDGPGEEKYGELSFAHTSPYLGAMHPGQLIQTLENNLYRAPIYEHPVLNTDFILIRTRNNYFIREFDGIFTAGQECPLYEVPGPNSKRANNFVRDFLQVFIYRLFWKSKDVPRRIRMDDIKKAFPIHSESSIRKRLKLCADFKRTGVDSNWWVIKPEFRLPTEEELRAIVSPEQCCAYFSLVAAEQRLKDAGYGEKFLFAPQDEEDDEGAQGKIDDEVKTAPWNTTRAYIQAMKGKCLLQLTGVADPTGCGEGFSYIRVPNKPQTTKEEQESQPKRIVTGTDADLRRLSLNNAKALLRKFGVPEEEIKKLSRWEVIDVVRTLSTEKAKSGEEGMTKFSRGNRFSVAEHQERYREECQRIFELQNRVLSSTEVLSTDEGESSEEELSDIEIEEMGKNIENMLSNKKTSSQLNHEREEQERKELQKMILGEGPEEKEDKKKKKKDDDDSQSLSMGLGLDHPGRILKIHRTFKGSDGKEYTRSETVRKSTIVDIYIKIRTTKDDSWIRQFALLDDSAKEEMKKEKRRIQEQLRRIKRNQEKEATGTKVIREPKIKPPKPIKLKDLKMTCGACGQKGHMRTNKACPYYQGSANSPPVPPISVAMTEEQEEEHDKDIYNEIDDDEELVKVDGTKVQLSGKLFKYANDIKRRSLVLKVPKEALVEPRPVGRPRKKKIKVFDDSDYLEPKRGKGTNRRRVDPVVLITGIFESIISDMKNLPDATHFYYPVNQKTVPTYADKIDTPMDLQTMREKARHRQYQTRSDFLQDVTQIYKNSVLFNGNKSVLTVYAQKMLVFCQEKLSEKEDKLDKLEKRINPLLDDDQKGLSHIFNSVLTSVKGNPESFAFLKPVSKTKVRDYYDKITNPMDFETIGKKIEQHKYSCSEDFLADMELIKTNSLKYNGPDSDFTLNATNILELTKVLLNQFGDSISLLEKNIEKSKMGEDFEEQDYDESNENTRDSMSRLEEDEEEEEEYGDGEYLSEEEIPLESQSQAKRPRIADTNLSKSVSESDLSGNIDTEDQTAIEAMMQLSKGYGKFGDSNQEQQQEEQLEEEQEVQQEEIIYDSFGQEVEEEIIEEPSFLESDYNIPMPVSNQDTQNQEQDEQQQQQQQEQQNEEEEEGGIWF